MPERIGQILGHEICREDIAIRNGIAYVRKTTPEINPKLLYNLEKDLDLPVIVVSPLVAEIPNIEGDGYALLIDQLTERSVSFRLRSRIYNGFVKIVESVRRELRFKGIPSDYLKQKVDIQELDGQMAQVSLARFLVDPNIHTPLGRRNLLANLGNSNEVKSDINIRVGLPIPLSQEEVAFLAGVKILEEVLV